MGPGLGLGARCWGRLLPLLRPRAGVHWAGTRPTPPQAQSRLGRGFFPASVVGARGLQSGARRDEADAREERAAAGHRGPKFDINLLVSLLRQENARDICVIQVSPELKYTDYFVIASGTSTRHLQALAQYLVKTHKFLKSRSDAYVRIEGKEADDWLCVDFGSMVIHLMLPATRETYELEKLWTLGPFDDQLAQIAPELLPEDFILGFPPEEEPSACSLLEVKRE
ncbi:mitochondrial assembly of ribosomal large subunit protein 1 [Antechinus flavipes]|uniref:mitochondrial assembly of ribosomal large subunit protein 1 n=1 Tax=Antechinus flavipes TaxID=38775 RepID=UPI00223569C1|nr:mitochondrial assembly of ribosomal large subunit protein 1 [Antechinus flavipes]